MPVYSKVPLRILKELSQRLLQLLMLTSMQLSNTGKLLKKLSKTVLFPMLYKYYL